MPSAGPSGALSPQGPPAPRRPRLNSHNQNFRGLGENLWEKRENRVMTDMTLLVRPHEDGTGQVEMEAHKLVLTAASPVISALCEERWAQGEGQRLVVELPVGIDLVSAQIFVKAVYTEKLEIGLEVETLLDLLRLTNHYGVGFLIPQVDEKLWSKVNVQNCVHVFEVVVKLFDGVKAKDKAFQLIIENIKSKLDSGEFKNWSGLLWEKILDLDYLKGVKEIDLFKALLKWRDAEASSRSAYFASLFPHIRLPLFGAKAFTDHVVPTGLLSQEEMIQFYAFFSGSANSHGIEFKHRNIMVAANSTELYNALDQCDAGDIVQLVKYVYNGHFSVKTPQITIRGVEGGGSVIEFASSKGIPALYVMPSARRTVVENIKFSFKTNELPKEAMGTGIIFRYSDSVHRVENLVMEGPGSCIRLFGTANNLMAKNITGEIVYAPAQ